MSAPKTAKELQAEGESLRKLGQFVPFVHPSEVPFWTQHNVPHTVILPIPVPVR